MFNEGVWFRFGVWIFSSCVWGYEPPTARIKATPSPSAKHSGGLPKGCYGHGKGVRFGLLHGMCERANMGLSCL